MTPTGTSFKDLPSVGGIYIADFDVFGEGRLLYEFVVTEVTSGARMRTPIRMYYVNLSALKNKDVLTDERLRKLAALMRLFKEKDAYDK